MRNVNIENINYAIAKLDSALKILNDAKNFQKDVVNKVSNNVDVISECLVGSNFYLNNDYDYIISKVFFLKKKMLDMVNTKNISLLGISNSD